MPGLTKYTTHITGHDEFYYLLYDHGNNVLPAIIVGERIVCYSYITLFSVVKQCVSSVTGAEHCCICKA